MTTTRERILAHPGVDEMWSEMGGSDSWGRPKRDWWVGLKPGWCVPDMECHTIHEDTQAECLRLVRTLVRCGCPDCAEHVDADMDTSECRCWWPGKEAGC
jgi:hypothetical protein